MKTQFLGERFCIAYIVLKASAFLSYPLSKKTFLLNIAFLGEDHHICFPKEITRKVENLFGYLS